MEPRRTNYKPSAANRAGNGNTWVQSNARKTQSRPLPADPALAETARSAPVNEAGMRTVVSGGEQGVAREVLKATVRELMKRPDPPVADALEYAMLQKWLGRFDCQRHASTWTAAISYADAASRSDRFGYVYRDVKLKVELAEIKYATTAIGRVVEAGAFGSQENETPCALRQQGVSKTT